MLFFYLNHLMSALLLLFKIWKYNKGKDCNLVIEGVACVTVGGKEYIDFASFDFFFLSRMGTSVLIVAWEPFAGSEKN